MECMLAALKAKDVSSTEKLVLIAIGNYANEHGKCYPSHATLAELAAITDRTVMSALKSLEARGYIRRERRNRSDGSRSTDMITLLTENFSGGGLTENISEGVGKLTALGGETISPHEPINNLKNESGRKTGFPPFWSPSQGAVSFGAERGFSVSGVASEAAKFESFHRSKGSKFADWDQAFRTWIMKAESFRKPEPVKEKRVSWV